MKENVRKQGILLPVSSIPSAYGIGTFGREAIVLWIFWRSPATGCGRSCRSDLPDTETLLISRFPLLRGTLTISIWRF